MRTVLALLLLAAAPAFTFHHLAGQNPAPPAAGAELIPAPASVGVASSETTPQTKFFHLLLARAQRKPPGYHRARMRYLSTDVPSFATGTLNCAANAAVFVYL